MNIKRILSLLVAFLTFTVTGAQASTRSHDLVTQGRNLLFQTDPMTYSTILAANTTFKAAVANDSTDKEANLFYSLSRIPAFLLESGSGGGYHTLRDLLLGFGVHYNDSIQSLDAGLPYYATEENGNLALPADSPTGAGVRDFLAGPFVELLDNALYNLKNITATDTVVLTMAETHNEKDIEVDYGDVLFYQFLLQTLKAMVETETSYNLDGDIDFLSNLQEDFDINQHLLQPYGQFLRILNNDSARLTQARTTLLDAISSYFQAVEFIKAETVGAMDELIFFDSEKSRDEEEFTSILLSINDSLMQHRPAVFGEISEEWGVEDSSGQVAGLYLTRNLEGKLLHGDFHDSGNYDCGFLGCDGDVTEFTVNDSTSRVTIKTSQPYGDCPLLGTLTGTMNSERNEISNGSYVVLNSCGDDFSGNFWGKLSNLSESRELVDFSEFFVDPIHLREYLPKFGADPYTGKMLAGPLPDRTFSGIFPQGVDGDEPDIKTLAIFGVTQADGSQETSVNIWLRNLAPWQVQAITLFGPNGTNYPGAPDGVQSHYAFGTWASLGMPDTAPNGWYRAEVTDDTGVIYSEEKYFSRNPLPVVETGFSPANQAKVGSTTPTFSWDAVTDESVKVYYRLNIRDWNNKLTLYTSPWTNDTSVTVPAGFLRPNSPYKWQVQVADSPMLEATNNRSNSLWRQFSTGAPQQALAISGFQVRSQIASNPDGGDDITRTQFRLTLLGVLPSEIASIKVTAPNNADYFINDSYFVRDFGLIYQVDSILPNGTYTVTVTPTSGSPVSTTFDFTSNTLDVPQLIAPFEKSAMVTATPTFTWLPVTDETAGALYYQLVIFDFNRNRIYASDFTTETKFTLPSDKKLLIENAYYWKVEVYDALSASNPQNQGNSELRPFVVQKDVPVLSVSGTISIDAGATGYTQNQAIFVAAMEGQEPDTRMYGADVIFNAGQYTIYNVPAGMNVYVISLYDVDGNKEPTHGDWAGFYGANPLVLSGNGTGIDLTIDQKMDFTRLYDDFSGGSLDSNRWYEQENVRQVDPINKVLTVKLATNQEQWLQRTMIADPDNVLALKADVKVLSIQRYGSSSSASLSARVDGTFYNTGTNPTGQTNDIYAAVAIGDRGQGAGLEAFWLMRRLLNDYDDSSVGIQTTSLAAGLNDSKVYTLSLVYDNDSHFTFAVYDQNGTLINSNEYDGPARMAPVYSAGKGLSARIYGTAANGYPGGFIHAEFGRVKINNQETTYDDFSSAHLDSARWNTREIVREITPEQQLKMAVQGVGEDAFNRVFLTGVKPYVSALVRLNNSSQVSAGGMVSVRLEGNLYNDVRGPGSSNPAYNGEEGNVGARVSMSLLANDSLRGRCYVDRDSGDNKTPLYAEYFNSLTLTKDHDYIFGLEFSEENKTIACTIEDPASGAKQTLTYPITTSIYRAQYEFLDLAVRARADTGSASYGVAEFDNVRVINYQDRDGDGWLDRDDAFPDNPHEWQDYDNDGTGDNGDWDDDNDEHSDDDDAFQYDPDEYQDTDGDDIGNNGDNCPAFHNPGQEDSDGDGIGDVCDSGFSVSDGNAFASDQYLYVANEGSGGGGTTVLRIAPNGAATVVGSNFWGVSGLALHADTGDLYVSDDSSHIYVVRHNDSIITQLPGSFNNPNALAFDSNNRLLIAEAGGSVKRLNLNTHTVELLAQGVPGPQAVQPFGDDVFFSDGSGFIYRIQPGDTLPITQSNTANHYVESQVVSGTSGGMVIDSSGNIYAADYNGHVVRIDAGNQAVTTVFNVPGVATRGLVLNLAQDTLLVTGYVDSAIYELDLSNGNISILSDNRSSMANGMLHGPFGMLIAGNSYGAFSRPLPTNDLDGDGHDDDYDVFPNDASEHADNDDDGIGDNADLDDDNDGWLDAYDVFPNDASEHADNDHDGIGDNADNDDDDDTIQDSADNCPFTQNANQTDSDSDGVGDVCDNCPALSNSSQDDQDHDGSGDVCDTTGFTHHLEAGWNLIALKEQFSGDLWASELAQAVNDLDTGNTIIVKVMGWDGSGWQTFSVGAPFGDFLLEEGVGYFLLADREIDWSE